MAGPGRSIRWWAGVAAATAGIVVLGIAAVGLAVSMGWQRERIVAALETRASQAAGAPVHIGELEGPLLPGFTARDVRVGSKDAELVVARELD